MSVDKDELQKQFRFSEYDLKSKDSKYRRWSPKMDQFLIKLLFDVVHSFERGADVYMIKKGWSYVCNELRNANPETVYSTYTKYSCEQHLLHVIHNRYKIWRSLMLYDRDHVHDKEYSYKWNPTKGRFQVIYTAPEMLVNEERQVKSLLYGEGLALPQLSGFNKGNLIVNDFFLSDNLNYMSDYHNEVLPMLIKTNPKYLDDIGDPYQDIPKFDYEGFNKEYSKPLPIKRTTGTKRTSLSRGDSDGNTNESNNSSNTNEGVGDAILSFNNNATNTNGLEVDESVDPALKRSKPNVVSNASEINADFENDLATATIAALNSPSVLSENSDQPIYIKDRKWFNKLISLHEAGSVTINEVLLVCEGVRDQRIPLAMLNILDPGCYKEGQQTVSEESDAEIVRKLREYMIPMAYIQRS